TAAEGGRAGVEDPLAGFGILRVLVVGLVAVVPDEELPARGRVLGGAGEQAGDQVVVERGRVRLAGRVGAGLQQCHAVALWSLGKVTGQRAPARAGTTHDEVERGGHGTLPLRVVRPRRWHPGGRRGGSIRRS